LIIDTSSVKMDLGNFKTTYDRDQYVEENFPQIIQFPSQDKKISSDWVKKYPGQSHEGPIFTAGRK